MTRFALFLLLPTFLSCGDERDRTPFRDDRPVEEAKRDLEAAGREVSGGLEAGAKAIGEGAEELAHEIDDVGLTTSVKAALIGASDLKASDVTVRSENGVVHLTGTVPTPAEKSRASEVARGVKGVRRVENELVAKVAGG